MGNSGVYHGTDVVSLIIPVYNTREYLDKCMESVIAQSYQDIEILLIDDGSTDGSGDLCDGWGRKDSRVRVFHRQNGGLGDARNYGIRQSTGGYIMFLDSDDWVGPEFVAHLYRAASDSNADMAFCDYYKVSNLDGSMAPFLTKVHTDNLIGQPKSAKLLYGADVAMWVKIYRRALFCENGIRIPDGPYEDTATYGLILASCGKIAHVKEKLLFYRINRAGSILSDFENRKYAKDALEHLCRGMVRLGKFEEFRNQLERFCSRFISYSLREMGAEQFRTYREGLISFLFEYFPNAQIPYGYRFLSIGSNNLYCIVNQIPYNLEFTDHIGLGDFSCSRLQPDQYGCIVIDFQEDSAVQGVPEPAAIQKTADAIKKTGIQAVLVQNRLAETYGEYSGEAFFEGQEEIKKSNEIIREKERIFMQAYGNGLKVIPGNEGLLFGDIHSRHGCRPFHLNNAYYLEMADLLINTLKGEHAL